MAPPTMAMMTNEAPRRVFAPRSRTASAKIVGNIIDMKKNTAIKAITDSVPSAATTTRHSPTLMTP